MRPGLYFVSSSKKENSRSCRKNYRKPEAITAGIFTVQCVCRHPKLLGVSVMMQTEGVSTELSALLSRFEPLPSVFYYDNACKMAKSIVIRVPWLNNKCLVVCDRFHYKGHVCNSSCDLSSYRSCNNHGTSVAESINHL